MRIGIDLQIRLQQGREFESPNRGRDCRADRAKLDRQGDKFVWCVSVIRSRGRARAVNCGGMGQVAVDYGIVVALRCRMEMEQRQAKEEHEERRDKNTAQCPAHGRKKQQTEGTQSTNSCAHSEHCFHRTRGRGSAAQLGIRTIRWGWSSRQQPQQGISARYAWLATAPARSRESNDFNHYAVFDRDDPLP
jgi:hypothetical protein